MTPRVQTLDPGERISRHRHATGYLAVVLRGSYVEAGDRGRFTASAGDVVMHGALGSHLNVVGPDGARILNLPVEHPGPAELSVASLPQLEHVERLWRRDPAEAARWVVASAVPRQVGTAEWPDRLARQLSDSPSLRLGEFARSNGLSATRLWRGFYSAFGVPPSTYRMEAQLRAAWHLVVNTDEKLSEIAAEAGFADQAHMTRAFLKHMGSTPGRLRRESVQEGQRAFR